MKCPRCGIHYEDDERECPMCGARKPAFQKDASQLARPAGKLARPTMRRKAVRPPELTGQPQAERGQRDKKGKIGIILAVLVVLSSVLLPALTGFVQDWQSSIAEPSATTWEERFPYGGVWAEGYGDTFALALYPEDENLDAAYQVQAKDGAYTESGWYLAYKNDESELAFPAQFPADQYTWWVVSLYPEEVINNGAFPADEVEPYQGAGGYISIFQSRADAAETYFYDEFLEIPWMEDETYLSVVQTASEGALNDAAPDVLLGDSAQVQPM